MAPKRVIIIGGGMAGLSAGTYLRMNGYETTIYEMNATPGGLCTSWQRENYIVDLCIHFLVGSKPGTGFYEKWNELIDLNEIRFVNHDEYFRMEDGKGKVIHVYADLDRLEDEFMTQAPEDEKEIRRFITGARKLTGFDMLPEDNANWWSQMKRMWEVLPFLGTFASFKRYSCRDYSLKFKNPLLRKVIANLFEPDMSIVFGMMCLSWFHNRNAGYPVGGSLKFAMKFYERYNELGGQIVLNTKVAKIITENNKAIGVELSSGERREADYVVSAADGYTTIFEMLKGWYIDEKLLKFYKKAKTFPSLVFIAFGVRKNFEGWPAMLAFPSPKPVFIDPQTTVSDLCVGIHNYDPTLAPKGATLLTVMFETSNHGYWSSLHRDNPGQYNLEKDRISSEIISILDQRFGNIRDNVEMVDVSTPETFKSFTGNWKGSFEGWLMTPETGFKMLPHTLTGLGNFYMCGHWVAIGGGLPGVLLSGRETAQAICREDSKQFVIASPVTVEQEEEEIVNII